MKTIDLLSAGALSVHFTLRRLVGISCLLALLAFPGGSFAASRMVNVSTRAKVGTGNDNVILGTIIVGSGYATLVFRGIGPSLAPYFPAGTTLANPNLQIVNSSGGSIGANNNWQDNPGQAAAIQAAGLAPTNANESAFWVQLGAGTYSAILTGVGGGTGIGLVEVYDITSQPNSIRLANVSTRAKAGTGNNTEVFGLIITGGNKSLGLRGLGPSLAPYLPGTLANPALSLMSGGSQLQYNQNWQDDWLQRALIPAYGLAPSNNLESAMVTNNLNGAYTVVMDTSGGSGITNIEAYDLGQLLGVGGGDGALVCTPIGGGEFVLGQTWPFTVPAGTPVTLRYGVAASQPNCPQCPASPSCSTYSWSVDAAFRDNNGASATIANGSTGPWFGQCTVHTKTTTWQIPVGYAPPYWVRIRGYSPASCSLYQGVSINVDYFAVNAP